MSIKATCPDDNGCAPTWNSNTFPFSPLWAPLCTVQLMYETRMCNGKMQIRFVALAWDSTDSNCNLVSQNIMPYGIDNPPDPIALGQLLQRGYNLLVYPIFEDLFPSSGILYHCPSKFKFEEAQPGWCVSWCGSWKLDNQGMHYKFTAVQCEENGCCIVIHEMCWQESVPPTVPPTYTMEDTKSKVSNQTSCINQQLPQCNYGQGWIPIPQTNCDAKCDYFY